MRTESGRFFVAQSALVDFDVVLGARVFEVAVIAVGSIAVAIDGALSFRIMICKSLG